MVGCTAEANSGSPGGTASPAVPETGISRQDIEVQLQPARVKAGQKVWVLANCPIPEGGPEHRGTASSQIFRTPVTLDPILTTPSPAPSASATPVAKPWVRGQATVAAGSKAGVYDVNARCEGTNDTGKASLRIVTDVKPTPKDTPTSKPTRTIISTHAPGTGGGGTAAGGPQDSGMPLGVGGALLAAVLAGGVGFAVVRRRRT
ncbi:hypothetical protein CA984_18500 [Streptosporangium minutum]|uniref:Uncharacterized protein n=2 Tax=Streptosporangium minutum TaxID=569862 RepID=A0A243RKW5_9ACTN|nr:hypothetical protein CA984_18500 [Streptosporangium minutum]